MKKTIRATIYTALLICLLIPIFMINAYAATAKSDIYLSTSTVYVGKQVTVTIKYTSDAPMGGWQFSLVYDPSFLEYVSGADSHKTGVCRFANINMDKEDFKKELSFTVTFKALKEGSTSLNVQTREIVGEDLNNMSISDGEKTVKITKEPVYVPSDIKTLSDISVEGFDIAPAFDSSVTEYSLEVEYPVTSINVSATPTSKLASVKVSGASDFAVGENIVTVTVTAENGSKQNYTIKVIRKESVYSAEKVTIDGIEFTFPIDETALTCPEGFMLSSSKYNGKDVISYLNLSGTIRIVALQRMQTSIVSPEGELVTSWFLYDEQNASFSLYIEYSPDTTAYVLLTPPDDLKVPDGYSKEYISIGNNDVVVFKDPHFDNRFSLVYACPVTGEAGIYVYDSLENTFQFFMTYDGEPTHKTVDDLNSKINGLETDKSNLEAESAEKSRMIEVREFIIIGLGILVLLLIIIIILVAIFKGRKKKNIYYDDYDDYDDEEITYPEYTPYGDDGDENQEKSSDGPVFNPIIENVPLDGDTPVQTVSDDAPKKRRPRPVRTYLPDNKNKD